MLPDLEWMIYKEPKKSVISEVFQGQEVSTLICDACARVSLSFQEFNIIYLAIPADTDGFIGLDECFMHVIAVNILYGSNKRQCDYCVSKTQGVNPYGNAINPAGDVDFLSPPTPRIDQDPPGPAAGVINAATCFYGREKTGVLSPPSRLLIMQLLRFDSSLRKNLTRIKVSAEPINLA